MNNKINTCLFNIKESINAIESYIFDKSFEDYKQTRILRAAVEREFLIIGEAMNRIVKINKNINITSTTEIINMRNCVVHGYDMVEDLIIWDTIKENLPLLKKEVNELLNG